MDTTKPDECTCEHMDAGGDPPSGSCPVHGWMVEEEPSTCEMAMCSEHGTTTVTTPGGPTEHFCREHGAEVLHRLRIEEIRREGPEVTR